MQMMNILVQLTCLIVMLYSVKNDDTMNKSSFSSVSITISSTTQSPPSEQANSNQTTDHLITKFHNATRYCGCDLTGNFCDLNCCCDQDCDLASKKLFSECLDDSSKYRLLDPRYCYNQEIIYKNNTNYILERMTNVGGLFCIYTDNSKQQNYLMDKKIVKMLDELSDLNLRPEFNWTLNAKISYDLSTPQLVEIGQLGNSQYRLGKEIYTLNLKKYDQSKQMKSLSKLSFPASLVIRNGECNTNKSVLYLQDFDSYCYKRIQNLQTECKSSSMFDVYSYNLIVIGNSAQLVENESSTIAQFCRQHNCVQTKAEHQVKTISYKDQVCSNVVRSVSYRIIYDEIVGIKQVLAKFEYDDLKQEENVKYYLKFKVRFIHASLLNKSMDISHYSGNLGYQLERPLLGLYLEKNKTIADQFKFINLQTVNDRCDVNNVNEQSVLFGLNQRSGCLFDVNEIAMQIEAKIQSDRQSWNSENICEQFNKQIYRIFQLMNTNQTFQNQLSAYGKYNLTLPDTWVPILKSKQVNTLSATDENDIKINCQLLKQINYHFVYAMVADSNEPQRKLISATQTQVSHSFALCFNTLVCTNQAIELSTSIQFVQMRREKRTRFAESPAFKLELPEDFFYPFV